MNQEQAYAVKYLGGPMLIIAGAGTGKTFVITKKIEYLIKELKINPKEILALTFTEKAASEMEERLDQILPYGQVPENILTFHSFADQILREETNLVGLNPNYVILDQSKTVIFLKKHLFDLPLENFRPITHPEKYLPEVLQHFNRLKEEDIDPNFYISWAKKQLINQEKTKSANLSDDLKKYFELAKSYKIFQELKLKENYLDFSDLVYYVVKIFREKRDILKKYQSRFKFILVDEFQDTNIIQYELIKILCPFSKSPNLTVVGDDSQSIYKFRGASISNILNFIKDYPNAKIITLFKNYRNPQPILDASYRLISQNNPDTLESKLGISKKLISQKSTKISPSIEFFLGEDAYEEAEFVVQEIKKLKRLFSLENIAILCRKNDHLNLFSQTLAHHKIPFQTAGPGQLFNQPEIRDLIALITFLTEPDNSTALFRILSSNLLDINARDIILMNNFAKKINRSLFEAIEIYLSFFSQKIKIDKNSEYQKYLPLLTKSSQDKLLSLLDFFYLAFSLVSKKNPSRVIYLFLEKNKIIEKLANIKSEKEEKVNLNISKFFYLVKNFEVDYPLANLFDLRDYFNIALELGESPQSAVIDKTEKNAVNLMTVHSAKGLEFDVVFLVNLTKGRFPTNQRSELIQIPKELIKEILPQGDYHLQEERRLFYVGMTRAKEKLYLTAARYYGLGKREQKISPFIFEALGNDIKPKRLSFKKNISNLSLRKPFPEQDDLVYQISKKSNMTSVTQLETYKICPLQYKYQFILQIPTPPQVNHIFGQIIHQTLADFYGHFKDNPNIQFDKLLEFYSKRWVSIGFTSKNQEERLKKEGEKLLKNYFDNFHNSKINVLAIEKKFTLKLKNHFIITGKIDRIDKQKNGVIELIDYKTGKVPEQNQFKNDIQSTIYLFAAKNSLYPEKKINQFIFTYIYLNHKEKISFKLKNNQLNELIAKITTQIEEITNDKSFPPNVGPWCDFCPFQIICDAWQNQSMVSTLKKI